MDNPLLIMKDVWTHYDALAALKGVSLTVGRGEIVSLIGANGAGKTTTLTTIAGLVAPTNGQVQFEGDSTVGRSAEDVVKTGIAMVPEGRRVFTRMSVQENLAVGAHLRSDQAGIKADMQRMYDLFPRLFERRKQPAGTLSGGEQQMLAIGRALMTKPKLLLLDEPSMGLAPLLVEKVFETIVTINQQGVTVLVVEQNAGIALSIANRGYVLENGEVVIEGPADRLLKDPLVEKAYLGI